MKLALVRDSEIYDRELLGMTIRERVKKTLERAGFKVVFFDGNIEFEEAETYLVFLEPVILLDGNIRSTGNAVLTSNGDVVGYVFGRELKEVYGGDLKDALRNCQNFGKCEVAAVKLNGNDPKAIEKAILKSLVKSEKSGTNVAFYDGVVSRLLNRRISLRISKVLAKRNVTPNQMTVFSFLLSIVGSAFFLFGGYLTNVVAGVIVQLHSILDGCDGEIARLKFRESKFGAWLDGVLDRYSDFAIIFCATFSVAGNNPLYWVIGFFAAFSSFIVAYSGDKFVATFKRTYVNPKLFEIPATRDVRLFLIFVGAILNQLLVALLLIAVLGNLEALRRIIVLRDLD